METKTINLNQISNDTELMNETDELEKELEGLYDISVEVERKPIVIKKVDDFVIRNNPIVNNNNRNNPIVNNNNRNNPNANNNNRNI